ncbi:hypothetical protein ACNKHM_10875 [Shigella sonnei]
MDNISAGTLLRHYCKEVEKYHNRRGGYFTPGLIPFSATSRWDWWLARRQTVVLPENSWADGGLSPMLGQRRTGANSGTEVSQ